MLFLHCFALIRAFGRFTADILEALQKGQLTSRASVSRTWIIVSPLLATALLHTAAVSSWISKSLCDGARFRDEKRVHHGMSRSCSPYYFCESQPVGPVGLAEVYFTYFTSTMQ